jgi:hypothetical protein
MAPTLQLNTAQSLIYSKTNIKRTFNDFDETDIAGIYRRSDHLLIVRNDGTEQSFPIAPIQSEFQSFTRRLKHFFAYLGPNYRGPSLWRHNAYVLFKGWSYIHSCGPHTTNAKLQNRWADRFIHLSNLEQLKAALQSDIFDLGHVIAPDGLKLPQDKVDLDSDLNDQQLTEQTTQPWCSCGSFQRQLNHLAEFKAELPGFEPTCLHMTWFKKYRELLAKRSEVRSRIGTPDKCVAWWYAPPQDASSTGRLQLLYTMSGAQAPLTHWRTYKPKERFTEDHAWDLFFNMMDADYVPFPGQSLPQLANAPRQSNV